MAPHHDSLIDLGNPQCTELLAMRVDRPFVFSSLSRCAAILFMF